MAHPVHQKVLCKSVLKFNHVTDVVTKIVNFIRARALNHRLFVALLEEYESEHNDIGYHTTVRWLSLGKVLKRVGDLRAENQEFCEKKCKDIPELSDADWMSDLAFAVDGTALMNELNNKLQGKGLFVHKMYSFHEKVEVSFKPTGGQQVYWLYLPTFVNKHSQNPGKTIKQTLRRLMFFLYEVDVVMLPFKIHVLAFLCLSF